MKIPQDIADKIIARTMTGKAAAIILGVSEQYVSRLLKAQGIVRIPGIATTKRNQIAILTAARKDFRKQLIAQVRGHSKTIEQAAKEGNCTTRTIYRMMEK